jgi:RNA polymerase sigma factor (sigma-70 family)
MIESPIVVSMLDEAGRRGPPKREEERVLIRLAQQGCSASRDELCVRHSPFVVSQVKKMGGWGMDYIDLFQEGMIGMGMSIEKFDLEKYRFRLISYAVWWIRQSMLVAAQNSAGAIRVPVNRHTGLRKVRRLLESGKMLDVQDVQRLCKVADPGVARALLDIAQPPMSLNAPTKRTRGEYDELELGDSIPQPFNDDVADADEVRWAMELIQNDHKMSKREKYVVVQRLFHGRTLDDISDDFGLSRERIRQIEKDAMVRVKRIAANYDKRCGFTRGDRRAMLSIGG